MRHKLKLDELHIETFHVLPDTTRRRGTVIAHDDTLLLMWVL
jgi:hypothetical protein